MALFPGVLLAGNVTCVAGESIALAQVKPVFKTSGKNSSFSIGGVIQESGKSVVNLSNDVVYMIDVPGAGTRSWTVHVSTTP
jgi:hypothetical protein